MLKRILFALALLTVVSSAQDNSLNAVVWFKNPSTGFSGWGIANVMADTLSPNVFVGKHFANGKWWVEPLIGVNMLPDSLTALIGFKSYFEQFSFAQLWLEGTVPNPWHTPWSGANLYGMLHRSTLFGKAGYEFVLTSNGWTHGLHAIVGSETASLVFHYQEGGVVAIDVFLSF